MLSMKFINKIHKIIYPITPKRFKNKGYKYAFNLFRNRKKLFITFHTRPKQAANVGVWSDELINSPKFAVVIQGPIMKEDDFTLETVKIYKKTFKKAIIILSTWENEREDDKYIKRINEENIEILFNKEPEYAGTAHMNYLITSSFAGIKKAKEMNVEYVLKTRTDQRICGINTMEFLYNLIRTFPVVNGYRQRERIVGVSLNTFKYRLYGLSEMTLFGNIEDMLLYWGVKPNQNSDINRWNITVRDLIKLKFTGETYLASEFLKKVGRDLKWTLQDSWQVFADHFCVVDQQNIDLYWHKYERQKEYRYLKYGRITNKQELAFREWFNLYSNIKNKYHIPEEAFDMPFGSIVPE
ncbi:MAG: WavE lipopolysaccharide synthesis family protein [Patescibacteria group bacterium]